MTEPVDPIFSAASLDAVADETAVAVLGRHLAFARGYTLSLLEDLEEPDWFRQPAGGVTHIAWQVGHIAMSQYGLALFRQRGRAEVDLDLMPSSFRKKYSRGTVPNPDPAANPAPGEIRSILDRVYEQVMKELPTFDPEHLNRQVDPPHAAYATHYGALLFAVDHEMLHAGQIGLIKRLIGKESIR
ncbi:MAG: DinB family protein [Planctomycetota bacterium]|nr:DinB family protein [Planctomycetota bacterium]